LGYQALFLGATPDGSDYGALELGASNVEIYVRWYFNISALTMNGGAAGEYFNMLQIYDAAYGHSDLLFRVMKTSTAAKWGYRVYIADLGNLIFNRSSNDLFTTGQAHCLEIHYKTSVTGIVEVIIDGVTDQSNLSVDTTAGSCGNAQMYRLGSIGTSSAPTTNDVLYFDDFKADITGPIGAYSAGGAAVQAPILHHPRTLLRGL